MSNDVKFFSMTCHRFRRGKSPLYLQVLRVWKKRRGWLRLVAVVKWGDGAKKEHVDWLSTGVRRGGEGGGWFPWPRRGGGYVSVCVCGMVKVPR